MNIFVVPSWYPSPDHPISGIMIKEQYEAFCSMYPSVNVGISVWGQKDEQYLLWAKDHLKNLKKIISASKGTSTYQLLSNLKEYRKPAFTWSQQIAAGNLTGIVNANLYNLKAFEADFGPVQLIHAHAAQPAGLIAWELSKKTGIPYCITERMGPFPSTFSVNRNGQLTAAYQEVYKSSEANIAVSPFLKTAMQAHRIERIKVIPDFVNEHFFKPGGKTNSHPFTFFFLGRLEPLKGVRELLEGMKLVMEQHQNVKLRIAGIGPQAEMYKNLAKELLQKDAITWLGYLNRNEILAEYQFCDAFVLPSHYETFGISYVEAMACGKPVIATKCGGPESVVKEVNGVIVEKEDPAGLARAMLHLVSNYNYYNSLQIRQDFLNRFSSQTVAPMLLDFYKNLIYRD